MKTLFSADEIKDKLVLTYLVDWPRIIEGKVVYNDLAMIDHEKGTIGEVLEDGAVQELKTEVVNMGLTDELKDLLLKKQTWRQVDTETGNHNSFLLPPEIQNL